MKKFVLLFFGICLFLNMAIAQFSADSVSEYCKDEVENTAFKAGETLKYSVSYNWGFLWVDAGEVTFTVNKAKHNNKNVYHLDGVGTSVPSWDWFFPVNDRYQSWVDPVSLKPYKFKRDTDEGGFKINNEYEFNWDSLNAFTKTQNTKQALKYDTVNIVPCTYDLMSIVYYARCIDFSKYQIGDTIPITVLLDNDIYSFYIRYLGKEKFKHKKIGKFNCIKFSAYLLDGTVFQEGEDMIIYVTDDDNKIPIWIEAPIIVGSVKVYVTGIDGIKNPMKSKIKD